MSTCIEHIDKPWGYEELIEVNDRYVVKKLFMTKGNQCSYQYHEQKCETITVLEGELVIVGENTEIVLKPFESMTIRPTEPHRMAARSCDCLYMECSTTELDDVVRLQDDYGRN